jgi:hypothetical protein
MWMKRRRFRNLKFEDRSVFGGLCPKMSHAQHVMGFLSILKGRGNRVAIFRVVGSLGGQSRSVSSLWG